MLTADLIRPRIRIRGNEITTQPLSQTDPTGRRTAGELIQLFHAHLNQPRRELDAAIAEYEGDRLDYPVLRGLAKVLSDAATFANEAMMEPADLRAALFTRAAERGPIVSYPDLLHASIRETLLGEVAASFGLTPAQVENTLYADLPEEQLLVELGPQWTEQELIGRYNLELARGLLYWASEMRLTVQGGYKDLFKYLKLFKLMHTIRVLPAGGYAITVDGPLSPFVQATLRYGFQMAKFLPGLMLCPQWTMEADIHLPWRRPQGGTAQPFPLSYRMDSRSELRSHYPASAAYDSRLEADFAAEFEAKFGGTRRKWALAREDEIIPVGDSVLIPDFSFTHIRDGRRALVELAGFWHPEYLRRKAWKLRQAGRLDVVLVAYQSVNTTTDTWTDVPGEVLLFASKPVIKDVLAAVERCAIQPSSDASKFSKKA
jgi:predicted nuclease of restriction endonuclease-like RecB superfamily